MIDVDLCRDSTLMMISAEVVERIVTINDNSPPQNYRRQCGDLPMRSQELKG